MTSTHSDGAAARTYTVGVLERVATPVLIALSEGQLKTRMPVETVPGSVDRPLHTHLEALGRLLAGNGSGPSSYCVAPE